MVKKAVRKNSRTKTNSTKVHANKARFSRRSKTIKRDRRIFLISKRTVLIVIVLAMIAVLFAVFSLAFSNPESIITGKINSITEDYYENYFYPRIEEYGTTDKTLSEILSRYTETGFSRITLRQLLLFDGERYADLADTMAEYCDIESTYVKIYPEPPFGKTNYRVDYHYACTF